VEPSLETFDTQKEKLRVKGKKLYFDFMDLEKAFDGVPREVIRWTVRKLGVEEWLISAAMSVYTSAKTHAHNCFAALLNFVRDYAGEPTLGR